VAQPRPGAGDRHAGRSGGARAPPEEVALLDSALRDIEPEDLIPHYEGEALDQADIYPRRWKAWEETFDPLGHVLEHYSFLQSFARTCTAAGDALLLYFVFLDDGRDG